jgi:mRNA interferase RelE/StbE
VAGYTVSLLPAAVKQLAALPRDVQVRVARKVDALARNARPPGAEKLSGADDLWRVRVGNYRVLYEIRDAALVILVVRVGHRREVYRR